MKNKVICKQWIRGSEIIFQVSVVGLKEKRDKYQGE
jgi:hypothetical protein